MTQESALPPMNGSLNTPLDGPLAALREQAIARIHAIADTLALLGDDTAEDRQRLREVAADLAEMFFLVAIIGEFNAGKSTFVNALLGEPLLPMGITPTTEHIELVRYSPTPQRKPLVREDGIRQWGHPNTGAPGVAFVDTPGTGSVFARHEHTAKAFLHRSDLVIFLLSAKRAFAETERLYLELARDYGKKIVLVVNQIDLLDLAEQQEVRRFVERQVRETLGLTPPLFTVSAKEALAAGREGRAAGGFDVLRAHLRAVFEEAPPAKQKLLSQLDLADRLARRSLGALQAQVESVLADTQRVRGVQTELDQQSGGLDTHLREASRELEAVFAGMQQRGLAFIDDNLTLRRAGRSANREKLQADFQDVVIGQAARDLNEATNGYINAVVDNSRAYWRSVIERLNTLQTLVDQELSGLDAEAYAEQRESLQEAVRLARNELDGYASGAVVRNMQTVFESNLNGFAVSALAAAAALITLITALALPGALMAGASAVMFVVSAPVTLVGGYAAYRYYQRVQQETRAAFRTRLEQLEASYYDAMRDLTRRERTRLRQYAQQVLAPIVLRLEALNRQQSDHRATLGTHLDDVKRVRAAIEQASPSEAQR